MNIDIVYSSKYKLGYLPMSVSIDKKIPLWGLLTFLLGSLAFLVFHPDANGCFEKHFQWTDEAKFLNGLEGTYANCIVDVISGTYSDS